MDANGIRTLLVDNDKEGNCSVCGNQKQYVYFCEAKKKVYCMRCMMTGKACKGVGNHFDYKIDEVKLNG